MLLTGEIRRFLTDQRLGFLATTCPDGTPNLSPKGLTFALDDRQIVIGEVRSPQTVANLAFQPIAEINVVDHISRKGFRFKGPCKVHRAGKDYDRLVAFLRERGAQSPVKSVIVMEVERCDPMTSPAYDRGATEIEVRREWKRHYDSIAARRGEV